MGGAASVKEPTMADATETKIDTATVDAAAELAYAAAAAAAVEVKPAPAAKPVAKTAAAPKAAAKKALKVAAPKVAAKKAVVKKAAAKKVAAKTVKTTKKAPAKVAAMANPTSKFMEAIMAQSKKTQTVAEDFTVRVKDAVADAQDRAKVAFEKSQELFGDYNEFTKGNIEALVESTKIFAAGVQDLGKDYVANGKTVLETVTSDVKELAAVRSPADFFKLQGEVLRRNFDAAVTTGSKSSEKVVKLANEAFAPIQNRVSLAIEKVKQAA
jgi:phasin family protein